MVTGDKKETAAAIARDAGLIDSPDDVAMTSDDMAKLSDDELKNVLPRLRVVARALPTDKSRLVRISQEKNLVVGMTGDGVNDAPALKAADVGIAMGGVGSDIAVDAADIALVDDEVTELPHLIALSKRMMRTIKLNITFSLTLNFIAIVLAITGTLNPVVGALVHNAGSVLVITNSALLLKWRQTASQSFASADAKSV